MVTSALSLLTLKPNELIIPSPKEESSSDFHKYCSFTCFFEYAKGVGAASLELVVVPVPIISFAEVSNNAAT